MEKDTEVTVLVEEHLVREIIVEVPDEYIEEGCAEDYAIDLVTKKYKSGDIVLDADDYNGQTLMCTEYEGMRTEWFSI
jgi:hypothetical protein